MLDVNINYLAILVAGIVNMVIGSLWYSPILFGKEWTKLMGWTDKKKLKEMQKKAGPSYAYGFLVTLVSLFVLAHFVAYVSATTFSEGMQLGFWVWLGFIATTQIGALLWEQKSHKLFLINTSYSLVSFLITGGILAVWH